MNMNENILKLIGNTPLVKINKLNPNPNVEIYAKLESFNPGGSVKDRIALSMIETAELKGKLKKNKIILEATSGNTGIGIAMVAAVKGYKVLFTMSESASIERRKILKAFGAEILLTPGEKGTDGAIEQAYNMAREDPDKYFLVDQFNNEANWKAHYKTTGKEIFEQTEGKVTHFVSSMGTTGTLIGSGRKLKELNPEIKIIGVEPHLGHKIQGLKNLKEAYKPGIWDKELPDEKVKIDDEDAYEMARQLTKEEGIFTGMSGGAAMHIAIEKAKELESGLIVVILADSGEKYLSTPLFKLNGDD
ncbi:PLP-dependent cysteine synthase family protein [Nanoarchaeota archaeon]